MPCLNLIFFIRNTGRGFFFLLIYFCHLRKLLTEMNQMPSYASLTEFSFSCRHLTEYLVAAFAKRLSRISLMAPPHCLLLVMPFIQNLLMRHQGLMKLIHNPNGVKSKLWKILFSRRGHQIYDLLLFSRLDFRSLSSRRARPNEMQGC